MLRLISLLLVCLFTTSLIAKDLVIVRGNGNYPPNEMLVNNTLTGFHIDLIHIVSARLGHTIEIKSVPWKRALDMAKRGTADAISYIAKNKEREKFVHYFKGNELSSVENKFFILKERSKKINYSGNYQDLTEYKIGVLIGYSYEPKFNNAHYLKKEYVKKAESQLITMLVRKRFDIAIGDFSRIKYLATKSGDIDKIVFLEPPVFKQPVYLGFSKAAYTVEVAQQFSNEFPLFKKTAEYKELLKKYGL